MLNAYIASSTKVLDDLVACAPPQQEISKQSLQGGLDAFVLSGLLGTRFPLSVLAFLVQKHKN
jgi:hypothetical protein